MIRFISAAFGVVLVGLITVPPTSSLAYIRQELEEGAKVSIDEARAIALQTRAGEITTKRWNARKAAAVFATLSAKSDGAVYKVGVDAQTGKVLENKKEGAHPD
jgi:uncharacterized membrane protein YkoI